MKKYHVTIFIVFFVLFFATISIASELEHGFMKYKWGESISRYEDLTELYTKKDVTYYSNPGESYTLDDFPINDVIFGFYKGNLFAVYIGIDTLETYDDINQHMKLKYGLPGTKISDKDHLTTIKWKYKDITIKLKTDEIKRKMKLAFYYHPLSMDLKSEHLEEINETSFRFFPIDKNKKPKMIPFLEF
ncbi:MAG: hypothetical protein KKC20_25495 [Proteobacteria bacterium]|nr:hypothetical protein [Pseudomonadota bacterium]MBU0974014.1 hypothetical protein [Pseudomonadota bacterium]